MSWLADRRARRAFHVALAAEVARMAPKVRETSELFDRQKEQIRLTVAGLPGATPACRKCGGRVKLVKSKWGRGKTQWVSGWYCSRCSEHHETTAVRGSWDRGRSDAAPAD